MASTLLSWWSWGKKKKNKKQEPKVAKGAHLSSSLEENAEGMDTLKFPFTTTSASRKVRQKRTSSKERNIDKEFDVVVVSSDGGCVSGSESDDSDWSIGWLEPHGPGFQDTDDSNGSFAVLIPCYGHGRGDVEEKKRSNS